MSTARGFGVLFCLHAVQSKSLVSFSCLATHQTTPGKYSLQRLQARPGSRLGRPGFHPLCICALPSFLPASGLACIVNVRSHVSPNTPCRQLPALWSLCQSLTATCCCVLGCKGVSLQGGCNHCGSCLSLLHLQPCPWCIIFTMH